MKHTTPLAFFKSDVSQNGKNNPEPWNNPGPSDQHKFFVVYINHNKPKKDDPDFSVKCFIVK